MKIDRGCGDNVHVRYNRDTVAHKILITTAIDYVNDVIHIGHAYQKIVADSLARYYRLFPENEVFFLTGTDEHGSKTEEESKKLGVEPQALVDDISAKDRAQIDSLNISYDRFIRTTDPDHRKVVTDFYNRSLAAGDIYKGSYTGLYCVGCEEFLKEKDLVNGKCPHHPSKEITTLTEENYFFKWSAYTDLLKTYMLSHPEFVQHEARKNEMLSFIEQGIDDIPISRTTVSFGIPVPNDPRHVLYVWFDALINYVTGAPSFWESDDTTIIHLVGKDNVRWHALLWPAMLMSAGYRMPSIVYGHDFFTLNGQKISKSLGNVIRPTDLVAQFGTDAVRYYFLRYGPLRDDVDVTIPEISRVYTADLSHGLGNLVSRVAKMAEKEDLEFDSGVPDIGDVEGFSEFDGYITSFRLDLALEFVWKKIQTLDRYVDHNRVWEQSKDDKKQSLTYLVKGIREITVCLVPFLPETAAKIAAQYNGSKVTSREGMFPRIS
ncbi:methionine--tRNA ligase [candidate division WWE3 bacterium CG_4_9_14_3_um_filter_41_6]|uniref:Methionine--tRNA ligase n=1 Tax=candidate division WWE3 bacterium CG_4_10_14_0_2_um_filter_41_14 TaxID=1975072 RepID=A0A2M7TGE8_UNCKA|nr:MAG: methionine--tRNA ligase [candidate division WWE3 bacterium CG_4_10_14_0_2_um_filter_41_14]PJA38220.1 MAG: methionine--tRNA ligase [candidate division WWE3 bacterium CG_4_9_14_3_um_filter_41_6]